MCALRPACRLSHKQERCRSPLRQIACKKVRYLIWKVKSTRYDASEFFSPGRAEERGATDGRNARTSSILRICRTQTLSHIEHDDRTADSG